LRRIPVLLALLACLAACRQRGTPDPNIQMAVSHDRDETAGPPTGSPIAGRGSDSGSGRVAVPNRLEVPPEVQQAYSGIRLSWKDATNGKSGVIEVPLGGAAPIPDSGLQVHADVYLPAFTMTADAITSSGTGEENPAARIQVTEGEKSLFGGWIFNRFPDVHPFQHPRFSIKLEGGIRRNATK
jgi:hypothetical protein